MPCSTPTRPLDTSSRRLLRRVNVCTERSFERTPSRHGNTKRKVAPQLSTTFASSITLLSDNDQTIIANSTEIDETFFSLDRTLTEQPKKVKSG